MAGCILKVSREWGASTLYVCMKSEASRVTVIPIEGVVKKRAEAPFCPYLEKRTSNTTTQRPSAVFAKDVTKADGVFATTVHYKFFPGGDSCFGLKASIVFHWTV